MEDQDLFQKVMDCNFNILTMKTKRTIKSLVMDDGTLADVAYSLDLHNRIVFWDIQYYGHNNIEDGYDSGVIRFNEDGSIKETEYLEPPTELLSEVRSYLLK